MGLKFRRGSTAQQSGSLAFGEPYVNTTLGTLVVGGATGDIVLSAGGTGSTGNFGAISGSGLDITGNANIAGNLTLGGAITIGDATADTVNVIASLSSSLIPQTTNAFDLGSATKIWKDLYISTGSIKFVEGTTVVKTLSAATLTALEAATGSSNVSIINLNTTTASLLIETANLESFTSSINTTIKNRLDAETVISGSSQINVMSTTNIARLATTGSNTFNGTQTINGGINTTFSAPSTDGYSLASMFNFRRGDFTGANIRVGAGSTGYTLVGQDNNGDSVIAHIAGSNGDKPIRIYTNSANEGLTLTNERVTISAAGMTVNGTITGTLSGNASTATTLATARTINGTSFNGSANITIPNLVSGSSQITYASISSIPAGIVSGSSQVTLSSTTGGTTSSNVQFNSLGIGMAANGTAGRIDASGDVVAFSTSDKNFKENITPIENAIEKIRMISGNTYDWKSEMKEFHGFEGNDVGVIAQEIEAVLPQLVTTRETGYKAVKYDKLVALLIEGIKEQQQNIDNLTIQVEELKKAKGL